MKSISPADEVWKEISARLQKEKGVEDILSCFVFEKEGMLQKTIHLLKYQGMKSIGAQLGKEVGKRILNNALFSQADILLPIPLHWRKMRERGYNQSEFLCRGISEMTGIPAEMHLLKRIRHTQSQTQLSAAERKENVRDAFCLIPVVRSAIEGKTVILVDDVVTTGSTIGACADVLHGSGVRRVLAASAALAP